MILDVTRQFQCMDRIPKQLSFDFTKFAWQIWKHFWSWYYQA